MNHNTKLLPRRKFFGQVTALGAATACGAALPVLAQARSVTASKLEQHVGESFYLAGEDSSVRVKLARVDVHPRDPRRPSHVRQDPFSVILHAPRGTQFKDQMCKMRHPELGSIDAFVSVVDQPKRNVNLQVVFG